MKWYLIRTKPNAHLTASSNLMNQKFEVFLPLMLKTTKQAGKFVNKKVPFFPSYLFIGSKTDQMSWNSINSTRGVACAVTLDGKYRAISNSIIEQLREKFDKEGVLQRSDQVKIGDLVKINRGPFANFICEVQKINDRQRICVLIEMLQQKTTTSILSDSVSKIY